MDERLYAARAEVLRALAHPTRLQILVALLGAEKCVHELREAVGDDLPNISPHLAQLRTAGLLGCRREGTKIHYRLLVPCLKDTFACVDQAIRADSERRA